MAEENGVVVIGLREIYDEQKKTSEMFQRLEMRFDSMEKSLNLAPAADERSKANEKEIKALKNNLSEYIERSERLERQRKTDRHWAIGIVVAIAVGFGKLLFNI